MEIVRTAAFLGLATALAIAASYAVAYMRRLWRSKANPRTREFGKMWCKDRGYIYREVENQSGGDPIRWWGVDNMGRHHKYRREA